MHILLLASARPSFGHGTAARTVLAVLMEELVAQGHRVSWATLQTSGPRDAGSESRLKALGVSDLGDFDNEIADEDGSFGGRLLRALPRYLAPDSYRDKPRFRDPAAAVARLRACGADAAILYWDSGFETLLPDMTGLPVIGYLARPAHAAPLARLEEVHGLAASKEMHFLKGWARRHFARNRHLSGAANICALDAKLYSDHGVPSVYVPNTWPDAFGADWEVKRDAAEVPGAVLGNIGGLTATGNMYGMRYLAAAVVPTLNLLVSDYRVAICGRGQLPADLDALLDEPHIVRKGFVPDIDLEVLSSPVFLLCNNAGPYTGGYTRVIYVMSSGGCLVAHKRLAESMPEVVHGENALLGGSGEEIAALTAQALQDKVLRRRIGRAARHTYEAVTRPARIAAHLAAMAQQAAAARRAA
jgi:hypothetical protein